MGLKYCDLCSEIPGPKAVELHFQLSDCLSQERYHQRQCKTESCDIMKFRDVGGCQNYGPFLDPYYSTAPNIQGTEKGIIILTTTHVLAGRMRTQQIWLQALEETLRGMQAQGKKSYIAFSQKLSLNCETFRRLQVVMEREWRRWISKRKINIKNMIANTKLDQTRKG